MAVLDELREITYRNELRKARLNANVQTVMIIAGAIVIAFFSGYVYRDFMKTEGENHA